MIDYKIIILASIILLAILIAISVFTAKKKKFNYKYKKINCLMTNTELKYFTAIKSILGSTPYILQPQVSLSSIVKRAEIHKYQSELSRIVDFCVFSAEYCPLLVIEINDSSHLKKTRKDRDEKVKYILKSAKIPLLTIWTNEKFSIKQIAQSLKNYGLKIDIRKIYDEIL